jgi:hypothetical protein
LFNEYDPGIINRRVMKHSKCTDSHLLDDLKKENDKLCRQLENLKTRSKTPGKENRVTTSEAEVDVSRAYDLNVNSYLVEPIDFIKFSE